MASITEALAIAVEHHRQGRLPTAESIYRQILEVDPNHVDALHLLGLIFHHSGNYQKAVEFIGKAARQNPGVADIQSSLGAAYHAMQMHAEAIESFRRAIALNPSAADPLLRLGKSLFESDSLDEALDVFGRLLEIKPNHAEAYHYLGNIHKALGQLDEAVADYQRVIELIPQSAQAYGNLAVALMDRGDIDEAISHYRRTVELDPTLVAAYGNLGNALAQRGKLEEALQVYRRAVEIDPGHADALCNLGTALKDRGNVDEAIDCYRRAMELKPNFAEAYCNLGVALKEKGLLDEAIRSFRTALELNPESVEVHSNMGVALTEKGMPEAAVGYFQRSLQANADHAPTLGNLGSALKDQRKLEEALDCFRRALQLHPDKVQIHNNLLMTIQYQTGVTRKQLRLEHAEFERVHASSLRADQPTVVLGFPRPLRLGFSSADFCRHPIGYFLIRCFENIDHSEIEVICYNDRVKKDDMTFRFQAASTLWRDMTGLTDEEFCRTVAADHIDVLFDLAGHTAKNRLLAFARKPAAIQITWAGYVGTTGLKTMDYILADRFEIPVGAEEDYCEKVLRMPNGYVTYDPPTCAPDVSPLPALKNHFVTFGCFNNPAKITKETIELWASVMNRVHNSRLLLKYKGMNDNSIVSSVSQEFSALGIDPTRLDFGGWADHVDLLAEYHKVDIALDPQPYNGGLTTCEALWMGVPVVTCPGETFASRHSLSHLSNIGFVESIANDLNDYVEIAVKLSEDLPCLAAIRGRLRNQMAMSPLCDGKRFAQDFSKLIKDTWQAHACNG